jgi:hypothetical protein
MYLTFLKLAAKLSNLAEKFRGRNLKIQPQMPLTSMASKTVQPKFLKKASNGVNANLPNIDGRYEF